MKATKSQARCFQLISGKLVFGYPQRETNIFFLLALFFHFSNPRLRGDGGPFHSHVFFYIFILLLIDNLFIKCGDGGKKNVFAGFFFTFKIAVRRWDKLILPHLRPDQGKSRSRFSSEIENFGFTISIKLNWQFEKENGSGKVLRLL
jgi:hypothetical protein